MKRHTQKVTRILGVFAGLSLALAPTTASAVKAGMKVTVDGEKATATTASGIFQLLQDGGASGSKAVGRFA